MSETLTCIECGADDIVVEDIGSDFSGTLVIERIVDIQLRCPTCDYEWGYTMPISRIVSDGQLYTFRSKEVPE